MTDVRGKACPHTKAFMYNDMEATDGTILRGELLTILRLMLGQLRKARLLQYRKAPVILYLSFPLPTVPYRVLCRSFWSRLWVNVPALFESYYNGQSLVLRTTKLYNFPEETSIGFKNLCGMVSQLADRGYVLGRYLLFFCFACSASEGVGLFAYQIEL